MGYWEGSKGSRDEGSEGAGPGSEGAWSSGVAAAAEAVLVDAPDIPGLALVYLVGYLRVRDL